MDELTLERYPHGVPRERAQRLKRIHLYIEDPSNGPDHAGRYRCRCGLLQANAIHRRPERSDEEKRLEARRIGES